MVRVRPTLARHLLVWRLTAGLLAAMWLYWAPWLPFLGLEMIMEAWGFEFPFNSRNIFVAEWQELWLRYLIARYDVFNCVYFWTPMNEYEYYPDGN